MHAISTDHGIGLGVAAVRKTECYAAAALVQAGEFFRQVDHLRWYGRGETIVQITAMHAQVGRAVQLFRHWQLAHQSAAVPLAVQM